MRTQGHHRRSIRLKEYDYSSPGYYFVTLCSSNRECVFGEIIDNEVQLYNYGNVISDSIQWLKNNYSYLDIDISVIMPNHIHFILVISDARVNDSRGGMPQNIGRGGSPQIIGKGGSRTAPTSQTVPVKIKPLGRIIGAFKTVSTKNINAIRNTPGNKIWHRNYYEHVIRNEKELHKIREYIQSNPAQWQLDEDNPENWDK